MNSGSPTRTLFVCGSVRAVGLSRAVADFEAPDAAGYALCELAVRRLSLLDGGGLEDGLISGLCALLLYCLQPPARRRGVPLDPV
jgi:hypothetical protein